MKIKSFTIHNFRSIKNGTFQLDDFSLLVGSNNAGKSNVVRALRMFYGDGIKFDESTDFPKFSVDDRECWIELEYFTTDREQEVLREEYRTSDNILKVRRYFLSDNIEVKTNQSNLYAYEKGQLSNNIFYGAKNISESKLGKVVFIPPVSKTDDNFKTTGDSPFRNVINYVCQDILKKSPSFASLQNNFAEFKKSVKSEKNTENISLDDVIDLINKELKGWDGVTFGLNLSELTADLLVKYLIAPIIKDSYLSDHDLKIEDLGQGFQRSLISTLIQVDAKLSNKKKLITEQKNEFSPEFTLLLFEEPEAFLHYSQEEKLNQNLRKLSNDEEKQVLITTHSPYFVCKGVANISNLIKLKRENGVTTVFQLTQEDISSLCNENIQLGLILGDPSPMPEEVESIKYFIWLDSERSALFYADKVLICEGTTEKVFLDYLYDNDWLDYKSGDFYILDTVGKYNIHRFMNLCGKLGIQHSVLFDGDNNRGRHQQINNFLLSHRNTYTKQIDSFNDDLETFLGIDKPQRDDLKPVSILSKYQNSQINNERMTLLREKIQNLFQ